MRKIIFVAFVTAAVTAFITAWGTTLILAKGPKRAALEAPFVDVLSLTRSAGHLLVQQFDAF